MKNFILTINKYKKWIVLILSILMFVLFFFPLTPKKNSDNTLSYTIPYFAGMIQGISFLSAAAPEGMSSLYIHIGCRALCSTIFAIAFIVLTVICLVFLFKGKHFIFTFSLLSVFLCDIIKSIQYVFTTRVEICFNMWYTFPITLILLILDIVYLVLERKYLKEEKQEKTVVSKQENSDL